MFNRTSLSSTDNYATDAVNVVVGALLVLSPWLGGFTNVANAATNAWIVGGAIALVALGAVVAFKEWEEWLNLLIGIWAFVAPYVLGFTANTTATYAHVAAGLIVAVLAAVKLWMVHGHPSAA